LNCNLKRIDYGDLMTVILKTTDNEKGNVTIQNKPTPTVLQHNTT